MTKIIVCADCRVEFEREPRARAVRCDRCWQARRREQKRAAQERYRTAHPDRASAAVRAYYEANRDEIAEQQRAYREANRDEIAEQKRAYYEANRDKVAERNRAYREANRDEIAEQRRAYREANRDKIAERQRAWRTRLAARSQGEISADRAARWPSGGKPCRVCREYLPFSAFFASVTSRDGLTRECKRCDGRRAARRAGIDPTRCAYCGADPATRGGLQIDHVLAVAAHGADEAANMVGACQKCNGSKGARPVREWLKGRLIPYSDRLAEALRPIPF